MNRFLSSLSIWMGTACAVLIACSFIAGCGGGGGHHGPAGKLYLTDVLINPDTNEVTAVVDLPENHYGFLLLNDEPAALHVVVQDGTIELGVLPVGDNTLCLELFLSPSGAEALARVKRGLFLFKDLTGLIECCDFTLYELPGDPVPPDDPPPDDPPPTDPPEGPKPKLKCRINYDGTVAIIVKLNGYGSVLLHQLLSDTTELCDTNFQHFTFDLDCGDHVFVLLDPETEEELARCTLTIPCPPDDPDPPEDPELPPKPEDPRTRYLVCHNGHTLLVPWRSLRAHLLLHGDTLGRCDDDDD